MVLFALLICLKMLWVQMQEWNLRNTACVLFWYNPTWLCMKGVQTNQVLHSQELKKANISDCESLLTILPSCSQKQVRISLLKHQTAPGRSYFRQAQGTRHHRIMASPSQNSSSRKRTRARDYGSLDIVHNSN